MLCLILAKPNAAALLILILSLTTACLSWFIQYTLKPGEIFGRYGLWLNFLWIRSAHKSYLFGQHNERRPRKWWAYLLPPLGLCPYCSSVWVGTAFYARASHALGMGLEALWLWPLFVGVQYGWVKVLSKLFDE